MAIGVVSGLWAILAWWIAPAVIAGIFRGTGIPIIDGLLAGRGHVSLAEYQQEWREARKLATALIATITIIGILAATMVRANRGLPSVKPPPPERRPDPDPLRSGAVIIGLSVAVGLGTGYFEAYYVAVKAFYLGSVVPDLRAVSQDSVWMIPIVHAALGAVVGCIMATTILWSEGRSGGRTAAAVVAFLGFLSLFMATGWVPWWVAALLAAGMAAHIGRLTFYLFDDVARWVRQGVPVMLTVPVFAALLLTGARPVEEVGAAEGSTAPASNAPNVLLVVLDTERSASTSLHGYSRPTTPTLDSLARTGVTFDRAISPSTWTLPSHAAMFTGLQTTEFELSPSLVTDRPVLAAVLAGRGYATAGFVGNIFFCSDFYGLDRGFDVWRDQPRNLGMALTSAWLTRTPLQGIRRRLGNHRPLVRKTGAEVNEEVLSWLPEAGADPWFVFVNYYDAHGPYYPPPPFDTLFADAGAGRYWIGDGGADATNFSDRELEELSDRYDNGVAYADHQLGRLLAALESRGEMENTLVIITSDHGELFGESGWVGHGRGRHIDLVHVPLLILPPRAGGPGGGLDAGLRVAAPVTLRDIPATVVAATHPGSPSPFPGRSLSRFWGDAPPEDAAADTVVSESGQIRLVVTDRYHYSYDPRGPVEELFDLNEDPREERELSGTPLGRSVVADFRRFLRAHDLYSDPIDLEDAQETPELPWH